MSTVNPTSEADLLAQLSTMASSLGGTSTHDDRTIDGCLIAIKSKWLLGGRKATDHFQCTLDPATRQAHFRESLAESTWGLPPPTFTVHSTTQYGARVKNSRVDTGVGGGGRLEFGKLRENAEQIVKAAGWDFVYEVV